MTNHKNRIAQLEKQRDKQPFNTPQVIEIWGMRMDGTQYLVEKRELNNDGCFVTVKENKPMETITK